jgi:hypothetical protein
MAVTAVAASGRNCGTNRHFARHHINDIPIHIGIQPVLLPGIKILQPLIKLLPILRPVNHHHRLGRPDRFQARPGIAQSKQFRPFGRCPKRLLVNHPVRGHHPVARLANKDNHRLFLPIHPNLFATDFHIHPLAVDFILVRVLRINPFDENIFCIKRGVGQPPGNAVIMSDHNAGNAGQ